MKCFEKEIRKDWIDDYLDLYLYAISIGDEEWSNHFLESLHNNEKQIKEVIYERTKIELYRRFDWINQNILSLYQSTRNDVSLRNSPIILDKILALKQEKINLLQKINQLDKNNK